MNCPKCGHEIIFGEESCKGCGAKLKWRTGVGRNEAATHKPTGVVKCPKCGEEIRRGDKFCAACGAPVPGTEAEPPPVPGPWKCGTCGAEMGAEARFCSSCGTARGRAAAGRAFGAPPQKVGGGREIIMLGNAPLFESEGASRTANEGGESTRDYDAAVRLSQEIESQASRTAWGIGGDVPLFFACFVLHELWFFVIVSCFALVVAASYRQTVRNCLARHDIAGARSALGPAKGWFWISMISSLVAWAIVLGRFGMVLQHFK